MKTLFAFIALAAIGFGIWWYAGSTGPEEDIEIASETSRPDPRDATFIFEDGPVTLKNGRAQKEVAPDSALVTETLLSDYVAYGDVNGDSKNDTAAVLLVNSGGSGIFVYVAAYVSGNVTYKGSNAVFVGDRVSPESISINQSGIITLNYLDRNPDEPLAEAPSVPSVKTFVFRDGELEER